MDWIRKAARPPAEDDTDARGRVLIWHVFNGVMVFPVADAQRNRFVTHWIQTPKTGWISREQRIPMDGDKDAHGCILVLHQYDGVMMYGIDRAQSNSLITHWMRTPTGPKMEGSQDEATSD